MNINLYYRSLFECLQVNLSCCDRHPCALTECFFFFPNKEALFFISFQHIFWTSCLFLAFISIYLAYVCLGLFLVGKVGFVLFILSNFLVGFTLCHLRWVQLN
jgi:hypothetical protein